MSETTAAPTSRQNENTAKLLTVALMLCLVCSLLVSISAIGLRPLQEKNKAYAKKMQILKVAGLYSIDSDVEKLFAQRIESKIVQLSSGEYVEHMGEGETQLSPKQDVAQINRRPNFVTVYLMRAEQGQDGKIILPVYGYGLWSTLYGMLALETDGKTIAALNFYEHGETAGLGSRITDPNWLKGFSGKRAMDALGRPVIKVSKVPTAQSVDAISGATLTSDGVTNLLQFWLGDMGFGPYLYKLRQTGGVGQ